MKISSMSNENTAPSWFNGVGSVKPVGSTIPTEEIVRIASIISTDEDMICAECDIIERCASSKSNYYYSTKWDAETIANLREYASAVGLNKSSFIGVDISQEKTINPLTPEISTHITASTKSSTTIIRTASTTEQKPSLTDSLKSVMGDPFRIEQKANTDHMTKENWQTVKDPIKASEKPLMGGQINTVRGGEDYSKNIDIRTAPGRNSITEPNAIGKLAEEKIEDTGVRLARERKEKEEQRQAGVKEWENGIIKAMTRNDIVPKGKVFPTENLVAQSGLNTPSSSQGGVYAKFDKNEIPEQTEGEKIKASNDTRKASISRERDTEKWHPEIGQSKMSISDTFGDALKKYLK